MRVEKMEVSIVSTEIVKPSCLSINNNKPYQLCLFDQVFPLTYSPGIAFYPNIVSSNPNFTTLSTTLTHLKNSLSETLNLYYPFSGRIGNGPFVDHFDTGVPFSEAIVNCRLTDYFKHDQTEFTNNLLPFPSFRSERDRAQPIPMLAIQANIFSCGGVAIGVSACHKLCDGVSLIYLFNSWAALSRGARKDVIQPNFSDAAILFPAVKDLPEKYSDHMFQLLLREGNFVAKTFNFSSEVVETLQEKARSEVVPRPTRHEAVMCFIWKHATEAFWTASGYRKGFSLARQAVNLRGRLKSQNVIGNLFWTVVAAAAATESMELPELAKKVKGAMKEYHRTFDRISEQGFAAGSGSKVLLSRLSRALSLQEKLGEDERPFQIGFSSLKGFFNDVDFGFGKLVKFSGIGKPGRASSNLVFLIDSPSDKKVEVTMILEQKHMAALECDVKFMCFASPNAAVSRL